MRSHYRNQARRMTQCAALLFGAFLVTACVIIALVPFQVDLRAGYNTAQGDVRLRDPLGNESELESSTRLISPGETVEIEGGSTLQIEIIEDSNAFAYLIGPATWKLLNAEREATMLGHMRNAANEYEVVIEQTAGTAVYDFSRADLTPADIKLVLRFPDGEYQPRMTCFQATAPEAETPSAVVEVPCGGGGATPEPTLPPLP